MTTFEELEIWLRKEADVRLQAAACRRSGARNVFACTDADREAAHAISERMCGRKLPKTTRAEDEKAARMQERIAGKIEQEAAKITRFADAVALLACTTN